MEATVSRLVIASIESLAVASAKDDIAPVLSKVCVFRDGNSMVAMATDRYMALKGTYTDGVAFDGWEDGDELTFDAKSLRSFRMHAMQPRYNLQPVVIKRVDDSVYGEMDDGTRFELDNNLSRSNKFPPVHRLFTFDREPDGVPGMGLRPDFVGKLAKVLPPEMRPDKERVWSFQFRGTESGKPGPVYANYSHADDYKLEALIQPALIK